MDDYNDQVIFYPNQGIDPHNRCCGGSMWCIRVIIIINYSSRRPFRFYFVFTMCTAFFQDICGIICAIFTWLLILYAEFVVTYVTLLPCPYPLFQFVNMVIFQMFAFLAMASHLRTMFTDPVRIRRQQIPCEPGKTYCLPTYMLRVFFFFFFC